MQLPCFFTILTFVFCASGHPNGHLPQLLNADGSYTNGNGMEHAAETQYANYYQNQPPQYHQDGFFPQAVHEFKQGMNSVGQHLQHAGESLSNLPHNFVDNVGHQISNSFENVYQSGIDRLRGLQGHFSEKFRPLIDSAIEIFQKSGNEKQHWNELVERVESTNLSEHEKQDLYQKIANATVPQASHHGK
ncbi:hypothetical protein M3Y98_00305500 [Aphelenchoides besseyi]|nr:hypothetical protein M3Y98_00305500 [Aphelenchoides besseyi]KAI6201268.1 hypothetical protein M3Y96_00823700 [Aphelenchoides besseyi]